MKYECLPTRYSFEEGHNKSPVDKNEPPSVGYINREYIKTGRNGVSGYTSYVLVTYKEREIRSNESTSV